MRMHSLLKQYGLGNWIARRSPSCVINLFFPSLPKVSTSITNYYWIAVS